jgi:hypothetical protein
MLELRGPVSLDMGPCCPHCGLRFVVDDKCTSCGGRKSHPPNPIVPRGENPPLPRTQKIAPVAWNDRPTQELMRQTAPKARATQ